MLRKYKATAKCLSTGELMNIKGGIELQESLAVGDRCTRASDCGHTTCGTPEFTLWVCTNRRCSLLYC